MVVEHVVGAGDKGLHRGDTQFYRLNGWEKLMTRTPCVVILGSFAFLGLIGFGASTAGVLPAQETGANFQARTWRENQATGALKWMKANVEDPEATDEDEEEEEDGEEEDKDAFRFDAGETLFFFWERCPLNPGCDLDLFGDEVLEKMAEVEGMLTKWDGWKDKYCTLNELDKNTTHARCGSPMSFMNFVHRDATQVEKLMDETDTGDDAIAGRFDFFGALCMPVVSSVSEKKMYDLDQISAPQAEESDCIPDDATTTTTTTTVSNSTGPVLGCEGPNPQAGGVVMCMEGLTQDMCGSFGAKWGCTPGCLMTIPGSAPVCFNEIPPDQPGGPAPVDQAACEGMPGPPVWGCPMALPVMCEMTGQDGVPVCFDTLPPAQGGGPVDQTVCEDPTGLGAFGATWGCTPGCQLPAGMGGACINEISADMATQMSLPGPAYLTKDICENPAGLGAAGATWGCVMQMGTPDPDATPAPTPAPKCSDYASMAPMFNEPPKVDFDPEKMGVGFFKYGLPPCESMAYNWWSAPDGLKKGAGKETIDYMCGITENTKDDIADLMRGSTMALDLNGMMGVDLQCPVAMGALGDALISVAPVFAMFPLLKRDLGISSDLVKDPAKSTYECNDDKQAYMLRSLYFAAADLSQEKEASATGPPPPASEFLLEYLKELWDKCDEIEVRLAEINTEYAGDFRGNIICGGRRIGTKILATLNNDVNMVLGSMSSCLILMSVRCDFLPAFAAILQIIMSILASVVFWGVLGYQKVTTFHNFLFFIIMGIGAAACFVLYDAYVQEQLSHPDSPSDVIFSRAYRRAVPAILLTSCTTMMGFLSAGTSGIPGIKTFGLFATLVIIFDFFFAITLFAATFYFCETRLKRFSIVQSLFGGLMIGLIGAIAGFLQGGQVGAGVGFFLGAAFGAFVGDSSLPPRKAIANMFHKAESKSDLGEELGPLELFFNGPFFNFLKKFGPAVLGLYLTFTAAMLVTSVLYLDTAKEATPFLRSDHPIQIFINSMDKFSSGADGEKDHVTLIFGLGKDPKEFGPDDGTPPTAPVGAYQVTDEDGTVKHIDPDDGESVPEPIFGGSAALLEGKLQEQIWTKCDEAKDNELVATKDTKDCKVELVDGVRVFMSPCRPGITCFMQPLREFIEHFGEGKLGYGWPPGKDLAKALESVATLGFDMELLENETHPYAHIMGGAALTAKHTAVKSCHSELVFKWKEIESLPDYTPGFQGQFGFLQKYLEFQKQIGDGFYDLPNSFQFRRASGWFTEDDELKAMWIRYNATIGNFKPMNYVEPIFNSWTDYAMTFDEGVPVHACELWGWYITQKEMVWGVVGSIIACAFLSWLVLAAGTANWVLATFAVFTIMSIIIQVMGSLVWFNNPIIRLGPGSLGIIETIGLSIAVGMSVDYTVHIVNAYNNCPSPDRVSRLRYSMTLMGISITLGMIATNVAAFFLLLCVITFFTGFGQFIIMTIFYSWLSAFFILCPMLMLIGPQGRFGEIGFLKSMVGGKSAAEFVEKKPDSNGESKPPSNVVVATSSTAESIRIDTDNEAEI
jgi:hypothetical protein